MQQSRKKEYMDQLKSNVLTVTRGLEKEDRKLALDYLRRHVRMDDLHRYALKYFPEKTIVLGSGSNVARLMIVTRDPIKAEAKKRLERAWEKMNIPPQDIYYAHLRFVATKKKQDKRQEILNKLVEIINPQVVLTFDNIEVEAKKELVNFPYPIHILTRPDTKEQRKLLTRQLKEVRRSMYK